MLNRPAVLTAEQRRERDFVRYRESLLIDEQTWVAENLDAPLQKPLEYHYYDGELWSTQGQALGSIFEDSIAHYEQLAQRQPELAFQARRSHAEYREYETMKAMARSEAPNTLVVISPYPRELEGAVKDILGYQARRRLGFIRVLSHEGGGRIAMWTHSIDLSDAEAIEGIYRSLDQSVDWGRDVLEQPVARHIEEAADRELLGDRLLLAYDTVLAARYGGTWSAGRKPDADRREAVTFVNSQRDLLEAHVDALLHAGPKSQLAAQLRYDFAAAMRRRFAGDSCYQQASGGSLAAEMATAGHEASERGEQASGCGLTVAAGQPAATAQMESAGYKLPRQFEAVYDECMKCPKCQSIGVLIERDRRGLQYTCSGAGGCGASTKTAPSPEKTARPDRQVAKEVTQRPFFVLSAAGFPAVQKSKPAMKKKTHQEEIVIGGVRKVEI